MYWNNINVLFPEKRIFNKIFLLLNKIFHISFSIFVCINYNMPCEKKMKS